MQTLDNQSVVDVTVFGDLTRLGCSVFSFDGVNFFIMECGARIDVVRREKAAGWIAIRAKKWGHR